MKNLRRATRKVNIGKVSIGGTAFVSVQSMVKVPTRDTKKTSLWIKKLVDSGCEIVRLAVKTEEDVGALCKIRKKFPEVPLVADIHFHTNLALRSIDAGVDAVRINPGNIKSRKDIKAIAKRAQQANIPIRIGVNSGSLGMDSRKRTNPENMLHTAREAVKTLEDANFFDIIISLKSSNVKDALSVNRNLANELDYPFHVGLTATGDYLSGLIKSTIFISTLLQEGIGDTIRVSLTASPIKEVEAARNILQALRLRSFEPEIISCPGCGRTQINLEAMVSKLRDELKRENVPSCVKVALMGCEVNGPGEAKEADVGIAAGRKTGVLFKGSRIIKKVDEKDFVKTLIEEVRNEVDK